MRPKRTDDKYWTGTRNFNHIQYESDLEDYIIDLENEMQALRIHDVRGLCCAQCGKEMKYLKDDDIWRCTNCNYYSQHYL